MIDTLYELCENVEKTLTGLVRDIQQMNRKIDPNEAQYIDYLTHTLKSLKCVIAMEEEQDGASHNGGGHSYDGGNGGGASSRGRGRGARRNAMGQYSSDGGSSGNSYGNNANEMIQMIDRIKHMAENMGQ